jgi:hypothetical protein
MQFEMLQCVRPLYASLLLSGFATFCAFVPSSFYFFEALWEIYGGS